MRLLKILLALLAIVFAGVAGYAYLGDMAPQRSETRVPVELDLGAGSDVPPAAASAPVPDQSAPGTGDDSAQQGAGAPAEGENALD